MFEIILKEFGISANASVKPFGSGLINNTWLISEDENDLILQRINHNVFKHPFDIAINIGLICEYFKVHHPDHLFVYPRKTIAGEEMIYVKDVGYFRLFPFI